MGSVPTSDDVQTGDQHQWCDDANLLAEIGRCVDLNDERATARPHSL